MRRECAQHQKPSSGRPVGPLEKTDDLWRIAWIGARDRIGLPTDALATPLS